LLAAKAAGAELDSGPRIEEISSFVESELARHETDPIPAEAGSASPEDLDELFRETLREVWGPAG